MMMMMMMVVVRPTTDTELVVALFDVTIADPLRLTVQAQYRMIGIAECIIMTLQGHLKSTIFVSCKRAYVTSC